MKRVWKTARVIVAIVLAMAVVFLAFFSRYYRADDTARRAMASDAAVEVSQTRFGWLFDGPSEEQALIFYPGARVEEIAYAPLLRLLAERGMDVCLVRAPLHLAALNMQAARVAMREYSYERWYIGGHSLGGVVAAAYATGRPQGLTGVILFAAYPAERLSEGLTVIQMVGSEDEVINRSRLIKARALVSGPFFDYVIEGGNHAQFGSYGRQRGDGEATISATEQIQAAAGDVFEALSRAAVT